MFFAYVVLRPAIVEILEPPQRLRLWDSVFRRFFAWVWVSIATLLASGIYMIYLYKWTVGIHIDIMLVLGVLMIFIYSYVYFALYRNLNRLVSEQNWKMAGEMLGRIRKLVAVNLGLGILTMCVALIGAMI
jgi:uncharacterized membrane protein